MTVAPYICQFKLKSTLKKEFIMAIQNTSTNTTVPNSAVTPPAAPAPQPTTQQASSWSFHKSFMRAPVAKNKGSEQLAKLQEK